MLADCVICKIQFMHFFSFRNFLLGLIITFLQTVELRTAFLLLDIQFQELYILIGNIFYLLITYIYISILRNFSGFTIRSLFYSESESGDAVLVSNCSF